MKDTKATQQMKTILSVLMNKEKVTTKDLANAVNLSEKTVRIRLNDLHDYLLKENLGKIERKTRVGVWLETNPKNEHALWGLVSTTQDIHDDNSRVHVIVKKFLMNPEESFTLNQLSDDLYLSPSTVSRVMDETEKWFKTNKIMFNRTQNRGHWIEFNEVEYRNAYMRLITILSKNETPEQLVSEYFPGVNLKVIKNIVNRAIINSKINPSDSTINNLLIMLSLVIYRNISSHSVTDFYSNALQEYSQYAFMENVVKELEDATNIKIHENEIAYLTVFFIAGGSLLKLPTQSVDESISDTSEVNRAMIKRLVSLISDVLDVDLNDDLVLFNGLLLHIKPAIFRMRYGFHDSAEIPSEINETFRSEYQSLWIISILFEEYYDVQISDIEIYYISLYVMAAIERRKKPLEIVLVSSMNNAQNTLLVEKLKNNVFANNKIEVLSHFEYSQKDIDKEKIIISPDYTDDGSIITISPFLTISDIRHINHRINEQILRESKTTQSVNPIYLQLIEKNLIFKKKKIASKEAAISLLCNELHHKGYVTSKYYNTVIQRERNASTTIGQGVAIPHGNQNEVNVAKIAVLVLEEPIEWRNGDLVTVVFLLGLRMKSEIEVHQTKLFYQYYTRMINTKDKVNSFSKMSEEEIFEVLTYGDYYG